MNCPVCAFAWDSQKYIKFILGYLFKLPNQTTEAGGALFPLQKWEA